SPTQPLATPTRHTSSARTSSDALHEHHYHPTRAAIHTKTYLLPVGTQISVRTEDTIDSATAVEEIGRASCREGLRSAADAEDGIRDDLVTGVQTCALPIFADATSSHANPAHFFGQDLVRRPARTSLPSDASRNSYQDIPSACRHANFGADRRHHRLSHCRRRPDLSGRSHRRCSRRQRRCSYSSWFERSDGHPISFERRTLSWHLRSCAGLAIDFGRRSAVHNQY